MSHYLLFGLMASFPVEYPENESPVLISGKIKLEDYLSKTREYGNLSLRPVLLTFDDDRRDVANPGFYGDAVVAQYSRARYLISVNDNSTDVSTLSDAIHAALSVLSIPPEEDYLLLPIDAEEIKNGRLSIEKLNELKNQYLGLPKSRIDEAISASGYDYWRDDHAWILTNILLNDKQLRYAALFLREAMRDYCFIGDEKIEILESFKELPSTVSEGVRVENAIHNSYKVIETLYGGSLPKKQEKLVRKFAEMKIDLRDLVGFKYGEIKPETVAEKIQKHKLFRDSKAAHGGKLTNRMSGLYHVMDFQNLALHLLMLALNYRLGKPVFLPQTPGA